MFKPLRRSLVSLIVGCTSLFALQAAHAQFTYQGRLTESSAAVNGTVNLRFQLFSTATGNTSLTAPLVVSGVAVSDGLFSTPVDFGSALRAGTGGWLEIAVLDEAGNATVLSPRQAVTPAPLATGIVGVPIVEGATGTDVDNTSAPTGFTIFGGGDGTTDAYLTFRAGRTGQLTSVTFRVNFGGVTFFANVYQGVGTGGPQLGSVAREVPTGGPGEFTLDLTDQNIRVEAGETYSVRVLCGTFFAATTQPAPGTSGVDRFGQPQDWWFRTNVESRTAVLRAVTAETAGSAASASSLNANAVSALNNREIRLRVGADSNHGLGYFGPGFSFRNTGFQPDGPVLFGYLGGGLGISNEGSGLIALRWNNLGEISIPGNAAIGRLGVGTGPSTSGFRLELPNIAGPAGQGRANAWVTYSSRAYKDEIQTLADPLATIARLRGVQFVWKQPLPDGTRHHDIGFIAEEVAAVVPDITSVDDKGNATGLDYGKIVPVTVEAIKAQQTLIESQRSRMEAMEKTNAELLARLEALERRMKP